MGKRKSTKYPGVQARESEDRRYRGRPDICYTIDYRDATGKRIRKDVGWASQGFSASLAAEMRAKLVNAAKTSVAMGDIPLPKKENIPTFGEAWNKYLNDWLQAKGKDTASPSSIIHQHLNDLCAIKLNDITPYTLDQLMAKMRGQAFSADYSSCCVAGAPRNAPHGYLESVLWPIAFWGSDSAQAE